MSEHTDSQNTEQVAELVTKPLIDLPANTKEFTAGGHRYFVEDGLSIERYQAWQKMELELGYGLNFSSLYEKVKTAYDKMNERKYSDVSVILYQIIEGAALLSQKKPIAIYVASLFINRADEDRKSWDVTLAKTKMADWADINVNFFLMLSISRVNDFGKSFKEISQIMQTVGGINMETILDQQRSEED